MSINVSLSGNPLAYSDSLHNHHIHEAKKSLKEQYSHKSIKGPVEISISCFFEPPHGLKQRVESGEIIYHTKKPNDSSILQFIEKCIHNVIIRDPSQIIKVSLQKIYSMNHHTEISISKIHSL